MFNRSLRLFFGVMSVHAICIVVGVCVWPLDIWVSKKRLAFHGVGLFVFCSFSVSSRGAGNQALQKMCFGCWEVFFYGLDVVASYNLLCASVYKLFKSPLKDFPKSICLGSKHTMFSNKQGLGGKVRKPALLWGLSQVGAKVFDDDYDANDDYLEEEE